MGSRWRSVCVAALTTEVELLWRSQSPLTSMAGTLGGTTNCSLQKLRRARPGDFRFFEASDAARWQSDGSWMEFLRKLRQYFFQGRYGCDACAGGQPRQVRLG